MKYFRNYPWGLQLLLFVLMAFTMLSFCSYCIMALLPRVAGVDFTQLQLINEHSAFGLIKSSILVQGIFSISMFLVPSLLFAYFTHPKPFGYVGIKIPAKNIHLILAVLLILGAMPVLIKIEELVGLIDFGASLKASQAQNDALMKAYLTMPTFTDFMRTFFVLAIIPAVGEELFFRGVLMKFAFKGTKRIWFSVFFTAFVFASTHSNVYGMFSIFLAGSLLATIYYLTGSLWCSIIAHLCFNGTQVVLSYWANSNASIKSFVGSEHLPIGLLIGGVVVFSSALYALIKTRTPLAANWTDDFDPSPSNPLHHGA